MGRIDLIMTPALETEKKQEKKERDTTQDGKNEAVAVYPKA